MGEKPPNYVNTQQVGQLAKLLLLMFNYVIGLVAYSLWVAVVIYM